MRLLHAICYLMVPVFVLACASPNSPTVKYYQLAAETLELAKFNSSATFYIEPIRIPEILKREAIVSYDDDRSQLILSKLHLWAGDLRELTAETLLVLLRYQLPQSEITSLTSSRQNISEHRIVIDIQEFSGQLGGDSKLRATWQIVDQDEKVILNQDTILSVASANKTYSSYVVALNQLLIEFSQILAKELSNIH